MSTANQLWLMRCFLTEHLRRTKLTSEGESLTRCILIVITRLIPFSIQCSNTQTSKIVCQSLWRRRGRWRSVLGYLAQVNAHLQRHQGKYKIWGKMITPKIEFSNLLKPSTMCLSKHMIFSSSMESIFQRVQIGVFNNSAHITMYQRLTRIFKLSKQGTISKKLSRIL